MYISESDVQMCQTTEASRYHKKQLVGGSANITIAGWPMVEATWPWLGMMKNHGAGYKNC